MKDEKLDALLKDLEKGVTDLYDSEKYRAWLDTLAKFPQYSVNNTILIYQQYPGASLVAGYNAWRDKFHRQVMKGQKGISIVAPVTGKKMVETKIMNADGTPVLDASGNPAMEQKEVEYKAFRRAVVFDISQTEGEPLKNPLVTELINPVQGYDHYMDAIRKLSPVPIRFDNIPSGAKGYYSPSKKEIVIQRGMGEEQTIKTATHECSHARLGHGSDSDLSRSMREVQAESIAYCVCKAIGIDDVGDYSFGYIGTYSSGKDLKEFRASLETIRGQAGQMIKGIQDHLSQVMEMKAEAEKMESMAMLPETIKLSMAM